MLGNLINQIEDGKLELAVRGFFNVEGGTAAVATNFFDYCDCTSGDLGPRKEKCDSCGRAMGNWLALPAGDGDGVYVVASISATERPEVVLGVFVVFDFKYGIANSVRAEISQERLPNYPLGLLKSISATQVADLGEVKNTGKLLFGDSSLSANSRNAVVDVLIPFGAPLKGFAFFEKVSSDLASWQNRLSSTQGMDYEQVGLALKKSLLAGQEALRQAGKSEEFEFPSFVPRCLIVLDAGLESDLFYGEEPIDVDWESYERQASASVNTAHIEPQHQMATWQNALLAREIDRAAGDVTDDEGKSLLFDMWTWCYQGALFGDQDCVRVITSNRYVATAQEESELLRRRGLFDAADAALKEPTAKEINPNALTKGSSSIGVPKSETEPPGGEPWRG